MSSFSTPLIDLLGHALGLTAQRQTLVSQNIANIDTPGYHARDIDFRRELQQALSLDQTREDQANQTGQPGSPRTTTANSPNRAGNTAHSIANTSQGTSPTSRLIHGSSGT